MAIIPYKCAECIRYICASVCAYTAYEFASELKLPKLQKEVQIIQQNDAIVIILMLYVYLYTRTYLIILCSIELCVFFFL